MSVTVKSGIPNQIEGDGDPNFPGGLGCPLCDSLWATSDSLDDHLAAVHNRTYDSVMNEGMTTPGIAVEDEAETVETVLNYEFGYYEVTEQLTRDELWALLTKGRTATDGKRVTSVTLWTAAGWAPEG